MTEVVHHLPAPVRRSPHEWVEVKHPHVEGQPQPNREWKCTRCPLVKITILPEGRRAYRFADGQQFEDMSEPECVVVSAAAGSSA